jgi:hypothetical protein
MRLRGSCITAVFTTSNGVKAVFTASATTGKSGDFTKMPQKFTSGLSFRSLVNTKKK